MKKVGDETRLQVMRLLAENPELTQRELADALGISLGATNQCLRALIDQGLLKAERLRKGPNKRAFIYRLTPAGIDQKLDMTRQFIAAKQAESEAIRQQIEDLRKELP